jgi:isopentenyl-diphosphate delta-isomerase
MPDQPLFANLGIAQIEELIDAGHMDKIDDLIKKLKADGLIIHINPLQEWIQPEGDRYYTSPIDLIRAIIDAFPDLAIIVKEVGQGMGPASLKALYDLPLAAVDFAAGGGTNFSVLEMYRGNEDEANDYKPLAMVGHDADTMVDLVNEIVQQDGDTMKRKNTIISGGVQDYLHGYYLTEKIQTSAIYGQASGFLKHAMDDYETLRRYVQRQRKGLQMAHCFLTLRP